MTFKSIKIKKISTQIAEQIRSAILAGEYIPGDKLPSERELADIFGVSRPSVREALNMLASAGLIASYQGSPNKRQLTLAAQHQYHNQEKP